MVEKNHMLEKIKKAKEENGDIKISQKDLILGLWQDFMEFKKDYTDVRIDFEKRISTNTAGVAILTILVAGVLIKLFIG